MRTRIVAATTVATLAVAGLAVAGPILTASATSHRPTRTSSSTTGTTKPSTRLSTTTSTTARVDQIKQALAGLVTDNTLTQAQVDKVASTLAATPPAGGAGKSGGKHGAGFADLAAAATAIGVTETELRTQLDTGESLAQIATAKGVSVDTVVTALVAAAKTRIAAEVTAERLTQAEADALIANLTARVTKQVNRTSI